MDLRLPPSPRPELAPLPRPPLRPRLAADPRHCSPGHVPTRREAKHNTAHPPSQRVPGTCALASVRVPVYAPAMPCSVLT
eukprot:3278054-Rhodomonas_salina.1